MDAHHARTSDGRRGAVPSDLPPWAAVYQQAQRWLRAGVFAAMVHDLRAARRLADDRAPHPSAAVLDGAVLGSTPESGHRAAYSGRKWKEGRKGHLAVDTLGHLLALRVMPADVDERAEVAELAANVQAARSARSAVPKVASAPRPAARRRPWSAEAPVGGRRPRTASPRDRVGRQSVRPYGSAQRRAPGALGRALLASWRRGPGRGPDVTRPLPKKARSMTDTAPATHGEPAAGRSGGVRGPAPDQAVHRARHYRAAATEGVTAHFEHDYSDGRLDLVVAVDAYPADGGGVAVFWRDVTARGPRWSGSGCSRPSARRAPTRRPPARRARPSSRASPTRSTCSTGSGASRT